MADAVVFHKPVVPAFKTLEVAPSASRGAPVSPRTAAKAKFTPVDMREMNQGGIKCARCAGKFSLFQGPDRCGQCDAAVCTKCSINVTNAPHLLKSAIDPIVCVSCWPGFRRLLNEGPSESREELQREVLVGDSYFALPFENRIGALESEALSKRNPGETTVQYFERNSCAICNRGYDLFRAPTSCGSCARHMCSSAACSKRVENLPNRPMTCRDCWAKNRAILEGMMDGRLSQEAEESVIVEVCLGNKFLHELRPAQQRVNIQHETQNAYDQADLIIAERRQAGRAPEKSPFRPAPPLTKPPVAPVESESSEEMTPRMETRAVVPDTTAAAAAKPAAAPVVVVTKDIISSSTVMTAAPQEVQLEGASEAVAAMDALATGHVPATDAVAVSAVAIPREPVVSAHKEVEEVHVAQEAAPVVVPEAAPPAAVTRKDSSDSLSTSEEGGSKTVANTSAATVPPTDGGTLPSCAVCVKAFNLFRREKQCSECQKAVCNQCVGFFRLRSLQDSKPRYICFSCLPAVRQKVIDPSFKGAELVRATREAAAVDLLLSGNLHQHYVSTDFSPAELSDMKTGDLVCARSGDKFDFSRPPRRCTDCNSACTARDCRNFDWVARILQRPQPSTLCRACWPAARAELLSKATVDKETEARVMDEIEVGDSYFALNRLTDFAEPPKVERGQRCFTCAKKFTLFRIPQKCSNCTELVCTGVACSGKFLVPEFSRTQPSVLCSGCLHKVTISRPKPGQLTSQQDNPLTGALANAVTSGSTCKECNKGFSFWERPHMCPETGNLVHVPCCRLLNGHLVSKSFGLDPTPAAAKDVVTLSSIISNKEDEDVESVSETDTSTSVEADSLSAPSTASGGVAPAEETRSIAESSAATSGGAVVASSSNALAEKSEDISTTSSTTDDEADTANTNAVKAEAPAGGAEMPKDFNLTSWYPYLKHLTAPTTFVKATNFETQALVLASDPKTLDKVNQADLRTLEGKLDRAIEEQGGVVFIKIETRSPKDVLQSTSMMDRLRGLVKPTMKAESPGLPVAEKIAIANADTIAFVKGIRQLFKVKTGAEAIAMLKMSERVKQDLEKALQVGDGSSLICVRRWRDVDAAREFRAFVFNRKLTGCSQYCYFQCFPELLPVVDALSQRVQDFFNKQVLPVLPYSDAVIDFHVTDGGVEIIELSPFAYSTGACMFSWKSDADKAQLERGPFELRILTEPKSNPYECLPSKWRTWFEQERGFSLRNNGAQPAATADNKKAAPAAAPGAGAAPQLPAANAPAKKEVAKKEEKKKWTFGRKKGEDAKKKK